MSTLALATQRLDFVSDLGVSVTAWRAFAQVQLLTKTAAWVPGSCVIDSGAPFSVIPYSLWHGRDLDWTSLGAQLLLQGNMLPGALDWQGIACELGMTRANLLDLRAGTVRGPFLVVGKFAQRPHPRPELEKVAILGLNFLTDNLQTLALDGGSGGLMGSLVVP